VNTWLLDIMACPRHHTPLSSERGALTCPAGCRFPVVDGVPVMLLEEVQQTMEDVAGTSLRQARESNTDGGLYVDSLGLTDEEKRGILHLASTGHTGIDPVVSFLVGATNGIAYRSQIGHLDEYPIPDLRLPRGDGQVVLDIGCNWGRWCVAASRKGYTVVGIDPSLGAVMAARRVARQCGVEATFIVGDARFLPLRPAAIDQVFSYSVLQHLAREDVAVIAAGIGRVLKDGGRCCVQMPTKVGLRCIYHQWRRRFRDGVGFEVRYWSLPSLRRLFSGCIGKTTFSVDCFFGIGLQFADLRFMTPALKVIVTVSEGLRLASRLVPPLVWVADSVYVWSVKGGSASDL
jgi:SAM-dependent methyltransferase/uncharacterized protein YbaR (Trm112 family)